MKFIQLYKKIVTFFVLGVLCTGFHIIWAADFDIKSVADFRKTRQFEKALAAIDHHLKKSPNDHKGLFQKGLVLTDLERYSDSLVIFQQLIKAYPYTPELYNNLGTILAFSGQYEDSQKAFQKALHLLHSYRSANKNLDALKFATSYLNDVKKTSYVKNIFSKTSIFSSILDATSKAAKTNKQNNSDTCRKLVESHMLIRQIQMGLIRLGYYQGKIDGILHVPLKSAIQDFQSSHHLTVNGYVSWKLLARIQDIIDEKKLLTVQPELSHIHRQRLTQKIQNGLFDLGYYSGPQNGLFNEETLQALSQFKNDYSIKEPPNISHDMSGHIMKALYQIQGKWTMVPLMPSELCTHYMPLVDYINSGYKPMRYIGYATILKHETGYMIMIVNTPLACRDMKKLLHPHFNALNQSLKK
ncbi:MAG: peptidoglycan-binding protein [Candidatus Magnetomorum sp.]|nr:peptidoglycan-binding protein [Candidatus Magnetomorum sp.]